MCSNGVPGLADSHVPGVSAAYENQALMSVPFAPHPEFIYLLLSNMGAGLRLAAPRVAGASLLIPIFSFVIIFQNIDDFKETMEGIFRSLSNSSRIL